MIIVIIIILYKTVAVVALTKNNEAVYGAEFSS